MPVNTYGQTYQGNDDFRGWLAGGAAGQIEGGGNNLVSSAELLKHVGNDATTGSNDPFIRTAAKNAYDTWNKARTAPVKEDPAITAAKMNYDATMASIAAQPKLLYKDPNITWQNAQNKAASTVNPVYADKINNYIERQAAALAQAQANALAAKGAADTSLTNTTADVNTGKTRTAEDTAMAIEQNLAAEGNWQTTEGATANAAEEQARTILGDQGVMGRGASNLNESKITRNAASNAQTTAYETQRKTTELLKTRTFADLDTKQARAVKMNETEKADLDRNINDFIMNQGLDLKGEKLTNEANRLSDLYQATESQYKSDIGSWLAGLKGRSQDIAYTTSVYGR